MNELDGTIIGSVNGVPGTNMYGLVALEVGYPEMARYRSGIFDTRAAAPTYNRLYWRHLEAGSAEGDVDIRIRSSNHKRMADLTDLDFKVASASGLGFFQSPGGLLTTLPRKRYVQYEAVLVCGYQVGADLVRYASSIPVVSAYTNTDRAVLRDVTIDWPGERGLVDLRVGFGLGPDLGTVVATVDGQTFIKSVVVEMEIFKRGRTGTNTVQGYLEFCPLNTGK